MPRIRQLAGPGEIAAALARGEPIELLLVREGVDDATSARLLEQAKSAEIPVRTASASALRRLCQRQPPADLLALVGRRPAGDVEQVLAGSGAAWLLVGTTYPGNAGFAIRTAEVSGADGIIIDARFDHELRRDALRLSMRADWFMPVCWHPAAQAIERAAALGRRIVAIETVGSTPLWEADLVGRVLFVIGAEQGGIPRELLERAHSVVRIPMAGFIPTYNLQGALAAVAVERLRQEACLEAKQERNPR